MRKIYSSNKETFEKKDFSKENDGIMHEWFPVWNTVSALHHPGKNEQKVHMTLSIFHL